MHPDWARSLRDQCAAAGVAFHFKQWGEWHPATEKLASGSVNLMRKGERPGEFHNWGEIWSTNVGKKAAGRLLDGVEHNGWPETAP
jgi:protein gp37